MAREDNYKRGQPETIGQRLREVRGGVSQAEFAQQLEVSQSSIANYETDKRIPDATFILELMSKFNIDPAWLISGQHRSATLGEVVLSNEELKLLDSYRNAGKQQGIIQTVAGAFANLEMEKKE